MKKILFSCLSYILVTGCVQRVVHEQKTTVLPQKPFKAAVESSECFTDRAIFDGQNLKSEVVESTALEIAHKFNQGTYEKGVSDCITTNGTGRKVVVFMCPDGAEIKDHFCYPGHTTFK